MKKKILLVLSILFGLMFLNAGLNKFFNYMPMPEDMPQHTIDLFSHMAALGWLLPLIGAVEVIAGILVMTNRFRALGAIMILPVMVGILLTHIVNVPENLPIALVLLAINVWMLIDNREKYAPLFR